VHVESGPIRVEKLLGRPCVDAPLRPVLSLGIVQDGKRESEPLGGGEDISRVLLKLKLGGVDGDDFQTKRVIAPVPLSDIGKCADAIHAGVVPKVDEDNLAVEGFKAGGLLEPILWRADKFGHRNLSLSGYQQ